jgi:MoaA/NifB/PqqE/SkfB family radical SAM enzyme
MPTQLVTLTLPHAVEPAKPTRVRPLIESDVSLHRLSTLPILILNIHERCNCRCVMCDIWKREGGAELDVDVLARHRESIIKLGVRQVVLTGGEPLLHTAFADLCSFLRECDVKITLLSTGLLLKKRAKVIASSVDEIILSLDGPEETHDSVRRVRLGFQLIREGILAVRKWKPEMPIHARCTVQKANHRTLRQSVLASHQLGLDSISFLAADVTSQAFNRELVWIGDRQSEIALSHREENALEEEIELLIQEHGEEIDSGYIVERPEKLRRIAQHFREHLGEASPQSPRCNAPWVSAVIEVDGAVRPCFFHSKIGSIRDMPLQDALNSEEARTFRGSLNIAENDICKRCVCSLNYRGHDKR